MLFYYNEKVSFDKRLFIKRMRFSKREDRLADSAVGGSKVEDLLVTNLLTAQSRFETFELAVLTWCRAVLEL